MNGRELEERVMECDPAGRSTGFMILWLYYYFSPYSRGLDV